MVSNVFALPTVLRIINAAQRTLKSLPDFQRFTVARKNDKMQSENLVFYYYFPFFRNITVVTGLRIRRRGPLSLWPSRPDRIYLPLPACARALPVTNRKFKQIPNGCGVIGIHFGYLAEAFRFVLFFFFFFSTPHLLARPSQSYKSPNRA